MNILFVYSYYGVCSPAKPLNTPEQIHFGISYISSLLKKHGHNTKLVVLNKEFGKKNKDIINEYLKKFYPRLICFTAVTTEYRFVADMARYIKSRYPDIYLLVGGVHVSLNPEGVLAEAFDSLCIGEGEYPTLELVSQLEKDVVPSCIPNLWIKHCSKIEKNSTRPFLQNLDSLPFMDRKMWQEWIDENPGARHAVLLGRGCPFQCTYCCNHAFEKLAPGTYVRFRSPDNIVEEIKGIADEFSDKKEFYLEVETVGVNKKWAIELCSKLKDFNATRKRPLSFGANLRVTPNADLEELFVALKQSNFRFINIGLESGSERVRQEILKRYYTNQDIINAVNLARKYGLQVSLLNMIGLPGETIADFKETVKVNRICLPDWTYPSIFFPYPGTALYSLCKEQGLLEKGLDTDMERKRAVLDIPTFPKKQVQRAHVWFSYYVYKGHRPLRNILVEVLKTKLMSDPYLNRFYKAFKHLFLLKRLKGPVKQF